MAQQLKHFFNAQLVRELAHEMRRAHAGFDAVAFVRDATRGLTDLELLDRGRHIAAALATHLPKDYPEAAAVIVRSLGPVHATSELIGIGMAPFRYLPHLLFIQEHGLDHFETSMQAQYELTKRFSAESSIRSYLAREPERTLAVLRGWSRDPDPHVRRLVSEGTRLRLPWAMRVKWLDQHPAQVIELLELLKDDPSTLVRRSVANNLNDLGKVHPELLVETCRRWLSPATPERRALVEHALRSAVKRGEAGALGLLGYGARPFAAVEAVEFNPRRVAIGGKVGLRFRLRSLTAEPQDLLVDVAVHFVKGSGRRSRRVFKLMRLSLPPAGTAELGIRISLAVHTTRKPAPGRHDVDVLVNGVTMPAGHFDVIRTRSDPRDRTREAKKPGRRQRARR